MSKPYFYKIQHTRTGKIYVGSQYGSKSDKKNFFTTYFTSSLTIQNIIKTEGVEAFKIVKIQERNDARNYEEYYLNKCYSLLGKNKFIEKFYNRNLSPGILLTEDIITKITKTKQNLWNSGVIAKPTPPNWKGKKRSETMRKRLSESKKGHPVSEETRRKLRAANLGKTYNEETKRKKAQSIEKHPNAYNRNHWLFISPDGVHYYTVGKRNERLHNLGLSEGPGFQKYCNTGRFPKKGKNVGWLFYSGKNIVNEILKNVDKDKIVRYE